MEYILLIEAGRYFDLPAPMEVTSVNVQTMCWLRRKNGKMGFIAIKELTCCTIQNWFRHIFCEKQQ